MAENQQAFPGTKEIAKLMGVTKQAVIKRANNEAWPFIEEKGRGGKGRKYIPHGLPADIQNKYIASCPLYNNKEGGNGDGATPIPQPDPSTLPATVAGGNLPAIRPQANIVNLREILLPALKTKDGEALPAATATDPWNALPESCRNKGYDMLLIINRMREIQAAAAKKEITPALKEYAKSTGYHYRSLYRSLKKADTAMKAAQLAGTDTIMAQISVLSPQHGKNKDKVRAFDKNAVIYAFSLYASGEMRTMQEVYRQTIARAAANNWQVGTYESLCNYLRRLDGATTTLAREGKKRFEADKIIKILRNYEEIPPNFMWCGDHHIFDVFVKIPDGKGGWLIKRPWLTSWMDMRSRSLMGWCINFRPDSRTIGMALAHGISHKGDPDFPQCGLPSSVYIDNGKDYRSKYLNGEEIAIGRIDYPDIIERFAALGIDPFYIDLEFDPEQNAWVKKHGDKFLEIKGVRVGGVYARLNIGQRYATAYHPWAKPIERFHGTLVRSFSRELPGWCGSGHEQRPEKLAFELKRIHPLLDIDEFCDRFYGWVVNCYHKTAHRGHGMNGMTPDECFRSLMTEPQTCKPALLDFALLKKDKVKIHNWGFNLAGKQFELDLPVNLRGGQVLNILIGQWATIFYDFDFKTVRVYLDGKWHCNARPLNRASFVTPNDPAMVEKLKLGSYQKRASAGTIRMIQEHPAAQEEMNEAAALLAMTHDEPKCLPKTTENSGREQEKADNGGHEADMDTPLGMGGEYPESSPEETDDGAVSSLPEIEEEEELYITRAERYRRQIIPRLATGRELTPAMETFRKLFESTREYLDSQELYETTLDYERFLAGGPK